MAIKIIGLIIGIILFCTGIYYYIAEKNDSEMKKICTIVSIVGLIISIICILLLTL